MQICVLNGSPKGEKSITMQYIRFLELANPEQSFRYYHIARKITSLESHQNEWDEVIASVQHADCILWATPVYFQHVPAQYKRFIELIWERDAATLFAGRYSASLTTSVHFFDQNVHEYLQGISEDLGMVWAGSFSPGMNDLLDEKNQIQLIRFGEEILDACSTRRPAIRACSPVPWDNSLYEGEPVKNPVDTQGKRILILHDGEEGSHLQAMVRQMRDSFSGDGTVSHFGEIGMRGGCLGCVQCALDNECVYTDNFCTFWREQVAPADIIIFAGTIRDRYLSSLWKQFFDRSFFLGHVPRLTGKQVILMVEGPLARVSGLRENLTCLIAGGHLVDIITDEPNDSGLVNRLIYSAAERAVRYAAIGYEKPLMFPSVAGHIVLRDAIWSDLRPIFRADHRYYKAHGLYDFPQYYYRKRISKFFFSLMMSIPVVQQKVKPTLKDHMIQPLTRVFSESRVLKNREIGTAWKPE